MNSKVLLVAAAVLALPAAPALAQTLQEQIGAVDSTLAKQQAAEEAARLKEQKRAEAKAAAARAAKEKARKRNEAHEDTLRDLEVENLKLDLQAKRMRVSRTDQFIDQELKEQAAKTDVIQSEADSNRNISSGIGEGLKSMGRAEEAKAKK